MTFKLVSHHHHHCENSNSKAYSTSCHALSNGVSDVAYFLMVAEI